MNSKSVHQTTRKTSINFKRFKALTLEQQAVVASAMLVRMLPNYQLFSQVCEFGNDKVMVDAVNILWEKQIVRNLKLNFDKQLEKIEPNVPDVADFDMFGVYPALDFAMALISMFNGLSGSNDYAFFDVCKLSHGTVTKVVEQELSADMDEFSEADIEQHELMNYENDVLEELMDMVEGTEKPNKSVINRLRERATADGISNIGIEIG